jgi:AraC-like DNA-binding protein
VSELVVVSEIARGVAVDTKRVGRMPTAAGHITRLAYARVKLAQLDPVPLLRKAKLPLEQIEDRGARINVQNQIKFLDLAADALRDPLLGFHIALDSDLRTIGFLYYVAASSETFGDALRRMIRYSVVAHEGVLLRCVDRGDCLAVVLSYVGVARHSEQHQVEALMTTLVRFCRELTGRHVVPTGVKLTHRRHGDCSEINRFLGTAVAFGAAVDEIVLPSVVKDVPLVGADPYLNELLIEYYEEALAKRKSKKGVMQPDIENAIAVQLPHGTAHLDEVARRLGMSRRTLARRLAAEGLTFGEVLNRLRFDLAQRHIEDPALSISQIAWLLGYQEVSAFTHAFKRWTGKTPREVRAQNSVAHT